MDFLKEAVELIQGFVENSFVSNVITVFVILVLTSLALKLNKKAFNIATIKLRNFGNNNVTYLSFLRHFVSAFIYFVAIVSIIRSIDFLSSITSTLLASTGIVAVVVGFASQEAMANIVSGVMILTFKPFIIGDTIRYVDKNIVGTIEDITLRHTVIKTFENKRLIVPNGSMNKDMIENANFADSVVCVFVEVGISYDSNIDLAKDIVLKNCLSHKDVYDNRSESDILDNKPIVNVRVVDLAESSIELKAWVWAKDMPTGFAMKCDLLESIKKDFDKQGIKIPYPHITISN